MQLKMILQVNQFRYSFRFQRRDHFKLAHLCLDISTLIKCYCPFNILFGSLLEFFKIDTNENFFFLITRSLIFDTLKPLLSCFLQTLAICAFLFSYLPKIDPQIHSLHVHIMYAIFKIEIILVSNTYSLIQ